MKQLTSSKPICYMLPNSDLVDSLPYIDEEMPQIKTKIQYLIKSQQQNLEFNQQLYLNQLKLPSTPFLNSSDFQNEVARIQAKHNENKTEKKDKRISSSFECLNANLLTKGSKLTEQDRTKIDKAIISYENNLLRQINLELYQKLAPSIQKQVIIVLDKKKALLQAEVERQKQAIEELNKKRQYNQLQSKQRQQTIRDRLQVMIHKKKKVQ